MAAEKKKAVKKKEAVKKPAAKAKKAPAAKKAVKKPKELPAVEKELPEEKALPAPKPEPSPEQVPAPVPAAAPKEEKKEIPSAAKKEKKPKKKKKIEKIKKLPKEADISVLGKRKKKPRFFRQEYYKLARLKDVWRKSRGIDSKKHEGVKGKGETPKAGYGNAKEIRGMHPTGFFPVLVRSQKDLSLIDPKKQAAVIAGNIGRAKRNVLITEANKLDIMILNPRKGERGK